MKLNKLNFGCGNDIRKGWENCDIQKEAPISFNANEYPYPLKNNHYDYILINAVLEFIETPDECLYELWEKCKNNAIIEIHFPYGNSKGAMNDIQTKHFFTDSTFKAFIKQPSEIIKKDKFKIIEINLYPTIIGKFFFKWFREKTDLFISGLI